MVELVSMEVVVSGITAPMGINWIRKREGKEKGKGKEKGEREGKRKEKKGKERKRKEKRRREREEKRRINKRGN